MRASHADAKPGLSPRELPWARNPDLKIAFSGRSWEFAGRNSTRRRAYSVVILRKTWAMSRLESMRRRILLRAAASRRRIAIIAICVYF